VVRSRASIDALLALKPDTARVRTGDTWTETTAGGGIARLPGTGPARKIRGIVLENVIFALGARDFYHPGGIRTGEYVDRPHCRCRGRSGGYPQQHPGIMLKNDKKMCDLLKIYLPWF
jgi:hypothetical protein